LDGTSSLRLLRDAWRTLADECGAAFTLVYLDVDHGTIRRRLADNRISVGRRDVADVVLDQHLADFETPEPGEAAVRVKSAAELPAWLKP
jgi:predicted kinase